MKRTKTQHADHPYCMALFNTGGMACAADTDGTIHRLSKEVAATAAVNSKIGIVWTAIFSEYIRIQKHHSDMSLADVTDDFEKFLKERHPEIAANIPDQGCELMVFGFGGNEIYPRVVCDMIKRSAENHLEFERFTEIKIDLHNPASFMMIGDFECTGPILAGATDEFMKSIKPEVERILEEYRRRVLKAVEGTPDEAEVKLALEGKDMNKEAEDLLMGTMMETFHDVNVGLETFNIEELVDSAETLVNAEIRLNHLKNGNKYLAGGTREIAVMTIPEGLTWIKHSLFAI